MLSIYRRHGPGCKATSRRYRRCNCRIWVEGTTDDGRTIKPQSLKTRLWAEAERRVRQLEGGSRPVTVQEAVQDFTADCERRALGWETLRKYRRILDDLKAFANGLGVSRLSLLSVDEVRRFAATRGKAATTARAELERLRSFFRFCCEAKWIDTNPVAKLKAPTVKRPPTEPFSKEEMASILAAASPRDRAFLLVGRYSGLRISDVATLGKDRIDAHGKLMLYQHKTGEPVCVPLPPAVVKALEAIPHISESFYFWTGDSRPDSAARHWSNRLRKVFTASKVRGAHFHRLRDTFAVELLLRGVPLEEVSALLGHSSVRITERHYAPWVKARQQRLEGHVRMAWADDPILAEGASEDLVQ